jgi:hypothetical protein
VTRGGGALALDAGVAQYLERYASSEARLADGIDERYGTVLVVPAFDEQPGLVSRYRAALESAPERALVIVVVNAARSRALQTSATHAALLADLRGTAARRIAEAPDCWLARRAYCDVLSIDRASPERCFADGEGVGLARRIGCDLALGLHAAGRIRDPFIYCTDADATLPTGYFGARPPGAPEDLAGLVFSFWHDAGDDPAIDTATALYELGLRYYVGGLASAGSPFAFHTLGSALAVRATAYAAVRGFPRRLAGEDFYLLNKLAKVGVIGRVDHRTLRLPSRASQRTAHGTGTAAVKLAAQADLAQSPFYNPRCFVLLGAWLDALSEFARTRALRSVRSRLGERTGQSAQLLFAALDELGAWSALEQAAARCHGPRALEARLHTWFDAFRTLKLIHGLRARGAPSVPFRSALEGSGLCAPEQARTATLDVLRTWFADRERQCPPLFGIPALPIPATSTAL